jgi:uncharacterized membrane protein (DUF485 family)
MNLETRADLRARQNRIDASVSLVGQEAARRYLETYHRQKSHALPLAATMAVVYLVSVTLLAYLVG